MHTDWPALLHEAEGKNPLDLVEFAFTSLPRVALSFSGAEDVVLIDMACRTVGRVAVFSLDTGRLHPETYRYLEEVRAHFPIDLEVLTPERAEVEALVRSKGLFSFYRDGHGECCAVRKVAPLRRRLAGLDGWITGQRRDQSRDTRAELPLVQVDPVFSSPAHPLLKFNPLAAWSSAQVWAYIRERNLPVNVLHERGFVSIGCEPCTRSVLPCEHERAGRWWWEESAARECGLHSINTAAAAT